MSKTIQIRDVPEPVHRTLKARAAREGMSLSHSLKRELERTAERNPHGPLLVRIWELRHNFTAHDAAYIALSKAAGAVLYTCGEKLRKGQRARVKLFRS